jgi:hypothetical protein
MGFLSRVRLPRRERGMGSATRQPVKRSVPTRRTRVSRAMRRLRKALLGTTPSRNTSKRRPKSQRPVAVYHHGTCTVNHRTKKAAARCRRSY